MPARTNEFQEMVALLTRVIREDESMTVTPSAMLIDVITGERREVDILVETTFVGRKVALGIECRDWKRPQNVQWVEETYAKHHALPVNVTVLVSSSGFTKAALKKASHYGMDTITPGEITPGLVGSVVNNFDEVLTKRAHFKVKTVALHIKMADGHLAWVPSAADSPVYTQEGTEIAAIGAIVRGMLQDNPAQQNHLKSASGKDKYMNIRTDGPTSTNGDPLYVIPAIEGKELPAAPILGMFIEGPVTLDLLKVPLTHGDYDGMPYSSGSATFEDMRISVAATESDDGTVKWAGSVTKPGGAQEMFSRSVSRILVGTEMAHADAAMSVQCRSCLRRCRPTECSQLLIKVVCPGLQSNTASQKNFVGRHGPKNAPLLGARSSHRYVDPMKSG